MSPVVGAVVGGAVVGAIVEGWGVVGATKKRETRSTQSTHVTETLVSTSVHRHM
jgi:hypothetical protein